jgi:hypothetical protein
MNTCVEELGNLSVGSWALLEIGLTYGNESTLRIDFQRGFATVRHMYV